MKNPSHALTGLIAAPFTAMHADGSINLAAIDQQAARLAADGVAGAFICGSTGEGLSLTTPERQQVAQRWRDVLKNTSLQLVVHVGHNSLDEARQLAAQARQIQADAVALVAPSYYKPATIEDLLSFCVPVARECAPLPFYFYHIPPLTGVNLSMFEFLRQAESQIPNLAGIKFSSMDLVVLQECLNFADGRFNILFGCDEMLLGALALGVTGAVGSTYNYCAPLYHEIINAFRAGQLDKARTLQLKSVKLVEALGTFGGLASGKAVMSLTGVDCGPVRSPLRNLTAEQRSRLLHQVKSLDIITPAPATAH